MDLNTILKNVELRKLLDESIEKTYYKYKLGFIIDKEDFKQDVYIFIIPRLKNFDNEKSSLKTYIPLIVMSCARHSIQYANGQSKNYNKLEIKNNTLSLEYEYENNDVNTKFENCLGYEIENLEYKLIINEILQMSTLTPKQKQVIYLLSKGYSIRDIADKLNKTTSCIDITFQRAKEKIVRKYAI